MNEEFKKRLKEAAERKARQLNFKFGPTVNDDLVKLIEQGVNRMSAFEIRDDAKKNLAESNLVRLVEAMVVEGRKRNLYESLDTRTFSDARMSICPLWPFC